MKQLIINIDDAGFSREINKTVELCYQSGVVTGVSLMAPGSYFQEACDALRGLGINEVGIHCTLTGDVFPCEKHPERVKSLLSKSMKFLPGYKDFILKLLCKKIKEEHIAKELENQVTKIISAGFKITHLDSHEHIHMFPAVLRVVAVLSAKFGIKYIRMPYEKWRIVSHQFSLTDFIRHTALKIFNFMPGVASLKKKFNHNDFFMGHFHAGRIDENIIRFLLENVSEGVTELAIHPAVESSEFIKKYPWYNNSSIELNALLSDSFKELIKSKEIQLVSHSETEI